MADDMTNLPILYLAVFDDDLLKIGVTVDVRSELQSMERESLRREAGFLWWTSGEFLFRRSAFLTKVEIRSDLYGLGLRRHRDWFIVGDDCFEPGGLFEAIQSRVNASWQRRHVLDWISLRRRNGWRSPLPSYSRVGGSGLFDHRAGWEIPPSFPHEWTVQ